MTTEEYIHFVRACSTDDLQEVYKKLLISGDWDEENTRECQIIRRELCIRDRRQRLTKNASMVTGKQEQTIGDGGSVPSVEQKP